MIDGKQIKNKSNPTGTGKYLNESGEYITVPSGGGNLISGTLVFDFLDEENQVIILVPNIDITLLGIKSVSFIPIGTSETSIDDFSLNGLSFNLVEVIDNTSFSIMATASNNASGNYTINYLINI